MSPTPRVKPVDVPWQVSPSTPFVHLEIAEEPQEARVTFAAHYGPLSPMTDAPGLGSRIVAGFTQVKMVAAPRKFRPHRSGNEPTYGVHRVRVTFEASIEAHFSDVVPEVFSPYDWSGLPLSVKELGIDGYLKQSQKMWRETSRCPRPGMYEVLGGFEDENFRRWLIQGHDFQVEVVAMDWKWTLGQPLKGW